MSILANSEDTDEMQHNAAFHHGSTLFVKVKKMLRQKHTIFFENYNMIPLDMYNGQVNCIKPEGKSISILYDFFGTVKAAPDECLITTGQP